VATRGPIPLASDRLSPDEGSRQPALARKGRPAPDGDRRRQALTVKGRPETRWGVLAPSGAYNGVIVGVA
jgi:hypothetical protein